MTCIVIPVDHQVMLLTISGRSPGNTQVIVQPGYPDTSRDHPSTETCGVWSWQFVVVSLGRSFGSTVVDLCSAVVLASFFTMEKALSLDKAAWNWDNNIVHFDQCSSMIDMAHVGFGHGIYRHFQALLCKVGFQQHWQEYFPGWEKNDMGLGSPVVLTKPTRKDHGRMVDWKARPHV